ncbi:MAG: LysR family transcriptional regulator [Actinobacteria bacterium]|nr:LysR family transcriptional regulator [Actinomycetota bacterium]
MKKAAFAIQVKTTIYNEESPSHGVLSMGTIALLRGVERTGSLNKAAKDMKMAYSKAWTLLRGVEENFGSPLIARDGARGSTLTSEGKRFIELYDGIQEEIQEYAEKLFEERLES